MRGLSATGGDAVAHCPSDRRAEAVTYGFTNLESGVSYKSSPGQAWIVYEWGVPEAESVGNVVIRPDGTDEHWATPDAPIAAGDNAGDVGSSIRIGRRTALNSPL